MYSFSRVRTPKTLASLAYCSTLAPPTLIAVSAACTSSSWKRPTNENTETRNRSPRHLELLRQIVVDSDTCNAQSQTRADGSTSSSGLQQHNNATIAIIDYTASFFILSRCSLRILSRRFSSFLSSYLRRCSRISVA